VWKAVRIEVFRHGARRSVSIASQYGTARRRKYGARAIRRWNWLSPPKFVRNSMAVATMPPARASAADLKFLHHLQQTR